MLPSDSDLNECHSPLTEGLGRLYNHLNTDSTVLWVGTRNRHGESEERIIKQETCEPHEHSEQLPRARPAAAASSPAGTPRPGTLPRQGPLCQPAAGRLLTGVRALEPVFPLVWHV